MRDGLIIEDSAGARLKPVAPAAAPATDATTDGDEAAEEEAG
jgi:hypothetical protein